MGMLLWTAWWGAGCGVITAEEAVPPEPHVPAEAVEAVVDGNPLCGDPMVRRLARGAQDWTRTELTPDDFGTGTPLFDEEWLFGTWSMAAVGLAQHARLCPSDAEQDLAGVRVAVARMMSPEGLAFDTRKYGRPLEERLEDAQGSIAALGYGGIALAMQRIVSPDPASDALESRWMEAIARRLGDHIAETYPRERYPVDNAAAIAALALHDRHTGEDHSAVLQAARAAMRRAVNADTGLLHQAVGGDGRPLAPPRGSGTFLSAWYLHRADPELGRSLYESGREVLGKEVFGIYAMREHLPGVEAKGDVDSGPLILGFSVSATGFALGGAVAYGDDATRDRILKTVDMGTEYALGAVPGLKTGNGGATGSALGDAILLAMMTSSGCP